MAQIPAKTMEGARFRIGADENGLGPRLGPLIVTAVLARVAPAAERVVSRPARGALAKRLGDSKALLAHGDVALGEAWTRALVERGCGNRASEQGPPGSPDDLVRAISLEPEDALRKPCPKHVEAQCWSSSGESFEAPDRLVRTIGRDLDRLAAKGIEVQAVRSSILCTKRLNTDVDEGKSRFVSDLHAMERLVLDLVDHAGEEVHAVCGKVGGFGKYLPVLGPLQGRLSVTLDECRSKSSYRFPGVGVLSFVQDADASDLLVSLSSMVGKYLREMLMARVVRFYRAEQPELADVSGYHDPVTAGFVSATALSRRRRRVPERCFERRALHPPRTS